MRRRFSSPRNICREKRGSTAVCYHCQPAVHPIPSFVGVFASMPVHQAAGVSLCVPVLHRLPRRCGALLHVSLLVAEGYFVAHHNRLAYMMNKSRDVAPPSRGGRCRFKHRSTSRILHTSHLQSLHSPPSMSSFPFPFDVCTTRKWR